MVISIKYNQSINQCVYFRLKTHKTETVGDRLRDRQT